MLTQRETVFLHLPTHIEAVFLHLSNPKKLYYTSYKTYKSCIPTSTQIEAVDVNA